MPNELNHTKSTHPLPVGESVIVEFTIPNPQERRRSLKALLLRPWRRFLAVTRINLDAVCEESREGRDYHDYPDSTFPYPFHDYTHTCTRCGARFRI